MKKLPVLLFIFLLSLQAYSGTLKCMTWNVENFFDTIDTKKINDTVVSNEEYQNKLTIISGVIKKHNPDIVSLCEVENIEILKDIATRCGYQYYYLIEGNDPRGIDVAVLSVFQLTYKSNKTLITPYPGNPKYKFSRDCTEGSFIDNEGNTFYIITTHLKSKYNDDGNSEIKQIAQVNGILDIISRIYSTEKKPPFILINGDFNSNRHSPPINTLEKAGLHIMNYLVNPNNFYTYTYKGKKQDLDYIIVNNELFSKMKTKKIYFDDSTLVKKASDHNPVILEFNY